MAAPQTTPARTPAPRNPVEPHDALTVRFAGDASDGIQLLGTQFTTASAIHGNAVFTMPDPPAEIRAPAGTLASVSGFQVHFSKQAIHTPGDPLNALIAMNPAGLKANLSDLESKGLLVLNTDAFTQEHLEKAGYAANPVNDGSLSGYRLLAVPMDQLNREAVARVNLSPREAERCKIFFTLGLAFWLFDRPLEPTQRWIQDTYGKNPAMIEANTRSLKAGYQYGDAGISPPVRCRVDKAEVPTGRYRMLTGSEALALGLLTASRLTNLPLVVAGFPLTPANELLHQLCEWKQSNVKIIQSEDDLAAINFALGASFGGALGVTATTGPGLSLQSDTLGLAVMSELPCVVIDFQRAGPSTGMPTKTEQADLLLALHGRHGECPLIVLAPATPADCFAVTLEAARLAIRHMTPVIVLADIYLASCAETWRIPSLDELPAMETHHVSTSGTAAFLPYSRDEALARPWAVPGTPGLEHRTGGLEKEDLTGNVSYDPLNHEAMVRMRARKIALVANHLPPLLVQGPPNGELLVLGWGSTFGAISVAVERCQRKGMSVASAHVRSLNPLPANVGDVLKRYRKVLVPELNSGQLSQILRSAYLVESVSLGKVQGRHFLVSEIVRKIEEMLVDHQSGSSESKSTRKN